MGRPVPLTAGSRRRTRAETPVRRGRPEPLEPFADGRLMARAGFALVLANLRYWTTVAPLVRAQLARWERHAQAIGDPLLRTLALSKLREERFNVEVAATLATLATRAHRRQTTRAIVALQVMYDYLDLLTEQPLPDPLRAGHRLYRAFTDALTPEEQSDGDYYLHHPQSEDGGYLQELVCEVRLALAKLPAAGAVTEVMLRGATRCAQAQVYSHAAAHTETAELERWARREATGTDLQWPELLAGASASVLALHALIAAAADPSTTHADAEQIDAAYLPICALTMLDSLVDREHDIATGELGYIQYYESDELMAMRLECLARDATSKARTLPNAAHHIVTLVGIVAYYTSAASARGAFARPVTARLRNELRPLITPTLAVMRAWRLAKWAHRRWRGAPAAPTRLERSAR